MNSTLIDTTIDRISGSTIGLDEDHSPVELFLPTSSAEIAIVIRAIYRQILGNAYIMESERLTVAESLLQGGEISVREFVRWLAKSELYKSRFINNCPRYRSHELNFKHLLGRAPDGYSETLFHSQILDSQGYEADIDSYIDSDEYQNVFGENIVPYYRGHKTQTGKKLLGYTNMFKMLDSVSTSDKAGKTGNAPRLTAPIIYNNPNGNVPLTDIKELLQRVLKTQTRSKFNKTQSISAVPQPKSESAQLDSEIAKLETQLAELQSLASIGSAGISQWQSYYIDITDVKSTNSSYDSLNFRNRTNSSQDKQKQIAALKQQVAQAQSLAALGKARLNKWRDRVFTK
ncbi:Phycobilisome Linker polypeptide [Xenococcus sp. PCC 7305]|uniref:phycobilisome rod-core linker polypeptide n=1 Tax=Xenococcus sp. PCC 7305 TaxID=102125 RepID=UPI0002AC4D62|nr:phycobilisome rod-core linker polypeptide [Xenococcus sp. PCC 7305]ELS02792.1 Phycobilisome Linker polypeptide [Xenococcus sp. PCC 7305]